MFWIMVHSPPCTNTYITTEERRHAQKLWEQTFWLHVWGSLQGQGTRTSNCATFGELAFRCGADKWSWKERLGACRRICFSPLIRTSILMGHLTLISEARPGDSQGSSQCSHTAPRARKWQPLRASKMHYLRPSVCSAFSRVEWLIVSIVPLWKQSSL